MQFLQLERLRVALVTNTCPKTCTGDPGRRTQPKTFANHPQHRQRRAPLRLSLERTFRDAEAGVTDTNGHHPPPPILSRHECAGVVDAQVVGKQLHLLTQLHARLLNAPPSGSDRSSCLVAGQGEILAGSGSPWGTPRGVTSTGVRSSSSSSVADPRLSRRLRAGDSILVHGQPAVWRPHTSKTR